MPATKFFDNGPPVWDYDAKGAVASGAPAAVTTDTVYLTGVHVVNTDLVNERVLVLTDTAGDEIAPAQAIPPGGIFQPPAFNMMPVVGIKAGCAAGAGLKYRFWGWKGV